MTKLNVIFMGSPVFAESILRALATYHNVLCVYTQPPRLAGKNRITPTPIHTLADELGIPVRTPTTFKTPETIADFTALNADVAVVAGYGIIVPQSLLNVLESQRGFINVHPSLLPRWRGATPVQSAIRAGDTQTGVTIMRLTAGMDTGPILMQKALPLPPTITAGALNNILWPLGTNMLLDVLERNPQAIPQSDDGVTYCKKIEKADALIDWSQSATSIERTVRAFQPSPGSYFFWSGHRIKVLATLVGEHTTDPVGTLVGTKNTRGVVCGDGVILWLSILQREGGKPLSAAAFLNAPVLTVGDTACGTN